MAALYDLMSQVAPFLVDCPEGVQAWGLRMGAKAFLADSLAYRETLTATADGVSVRFLLADFDTLPAHTLVKAAAELLVDGVALDSGEWGISRNNLIFRTAPKADAVLSLEVALVSDGNLVTIPDDIQAAYGEAIAAHALFLIMSQPRRPYSDPPGAAQELARYSRLLHEAHVARETAGKTGPDAFINPLPDYF